MKIYWNEAVEGFNRCIRIWFYKKKLLGESHSDFFIDILKVSLYFVDRFNELLFSDPINK